MSACTAQDVFIYLLKRDAIDAIKIVLKHPNNDAAHDLNYIFCLASKIGNVNMVKLLLADPQVNPADNNRAIMWASQRGHVEVLKLLLEDSRVEPTSAAFKAAAQNGQLEAVKLLLERPEINPVNDENTIACLQCEEANAYKEKSYVKKQNVRKALMDASSADHGEIMSLLIKLVDISLEESIGALRQETLNGNKKSVSVWLDYLGHRANYSLYHNIKYGVYRYTGQRGNMKDDMDALWKYHLLTHCVDTRDKIVRGQMPDW